MVRVGSLKTFKTPFPVLKAGLPVSSLKSTHIGAHTFEHTPVVSLVHDPTDIPWVVGCAGKVGSEILSKH